MKNPDFVFDQQWNPNRWWALVILLLGNFMVILDTFIVNVALPTIQGQLHANESQIQLVVAVYVLAYAVLLIIGARLGDWLGRKQMFISGMVIFTFASALCGIAIETNFLIVARVIQGMGAAILIPQVLSIIQVIFPPDERGRAIGLYGAISGLALIAGQIFGGLLIHFNIFGLGWRSVFLINVPVGIISIICILPLIKDIRTRDNAAIDSVGSIMLTSSLILLVYPLIIGREVGWPIWIFCMLVGSAAIFGTFIYHQKKIIKANRTPLIPLSIFRQSIFTIGVLTIFMFQIANSGFFLVTSLFLQNGLSISAMQSALAFAPIGVGFFLGSLYGPKWAKQNAHVLKIGAWGLVLGFSIVTIVLMTVDALQWQTFVIPFFVIGLGQGLIGAPLMGVIMSGVGKEYAGSASGVISTFMQIANTLGVAIIGTIFFSILQTTSYNYAFVISITISIGFGVVILTLLHRLQGKRIYAIQKI
ncbi:MFS transporter [Ferdinandcohnia quinoae]|uniref:MFS transporter n=1 Tax=Fredinandcohnia quinoae TaxID=2918902 RepID=A0AAW5EDP4_9BACI|nr:MFS transporter [Fredinandcohnia sp. SECRCQ15]MCH1626889.1 MFS transporter [Fredinandcohnia sp. SECRCQ15]